MEEKTKPKKVEPNTEPIIEWIAHPARQRPLAAWLVSAFIAVIAVGIYSWTFSPIFTALATIILIGSLSGFYFPTHYRFYDDQIIVKYTLTTIKKEWSQFRSYYRDRNGVLLSPFAQPTRLENFRGIFLKFGEGDRDKILEIVKSKIVKDSDGS
jgi:hypothetical protein